MNQWLKSYGILVLSLLALFASGVFIGRMTSPRTKQAASPAISVPTNTDAWVEAASSGLVKNLQLDEAQQRKVQQHLEPVAFAIFADQERALFQMHLRLLELHDTLSSSGNLNEIQTTRLAVSRAKLKALIIDKFPNLVRGNPSLEIGNNPP
jgi:hypothetical protein